MDANIVDIFYLVDEFCKKIDKDTEDISFKMIAAKSPVNVLFACRTVK